jgi:hypothetical protein
VAAPKRIVYILKSVNSPLTYYVGVTSDMTARLEAHNAGLSPHTAEHRPWRTRRDRIRRGSTGIGVREISEDRIGSRIREAPFPSELPIGLALLATLPAAGLDRACAQAVHAVIVGRGRNRR